MAGKEQKSLKRNFFMNAILTVSSFIFPLITFPYASRVLLPAGTGKVSFAASLIAYFSMFSQLGIPTYGVRACAKVRDDREELTRTAHELLFINLITSCVSYVVLAALLIAVPRLWEDRILYIVMSMAIILSSIGMEWLYKALEQYTYITIRSIVFKFIALIGMFALVHTRSDYVIYGAITIFAAFASNILNFINLPRYIDLKPLGKYHVQRHLKAVLVFFAMSCAVTIYTNVDTVMIGFLKSDADVGYYNAAVKIKNVLISIVTSLGTVLLPRVSYYVENGRTEDFRRISEKAFHFVVVLACPLVIYFILFAREGIYFLSGSAFANSVIPMQIIMPTVLLIGITNIWGIQILVPLGEEKTVLYSEVAGAVVDIIINALLIPSLASIGAAIGTLVAEFVVLLIQQNALRKRKIHISREIKFEKIATAILVSTFFAVLIKQLVLGNFITLMVSGGVFFTTYILILAVTKEALIVELLGQLINRKKGT